LNDMPSPRSFFGSLETPDAPTRALSACQLDGLPVRVGGRVQLADGGQLLEVYQDGSCRPAHEVLIGSDRRLYAVHPWTATPLGQQGIVPDTDVVRALEAHYQELFRKLAPSVVIVSPGPSFGSGSFVHPDGLILTNAHVVHDNKKVDVVLFSGKHVEGKVVERAGRGVDLALVQVPEKGPPLSLDGMTNLKVGSWVASCGNGAGGIWTFNVGIVTNIYRTKAEGRVFQTQIPLNPGSSGGPVVDRLGRIAGIVTAGILLSNSINFAISVEAALNHLKTLRELIARGEVKAPGDRGAEQVLPPPTEDPAGGPPPTQTGPGKQTAPGGGGGGQTAPKKKPAGA
jgi:S1-C subfamily serine protease